MLAGTTVLASFTWPSAPTGGCWHPVIDTIKLWDVATGRGGPATLAGHKETIPWPSAQTGGMLASGGETMYSLGIGRWTGSSQARGVMSIVVSVAFSPNGRILASGQRRTIRSIWDRSRRCVPPARRRIA